MIARCIWFSIVYLCMIGNVGAMPPPLQQPGNNNLPTTPTKPAQHPKPNTPSTPAPPPPHPAQQQPAGPHLGPAMESVFSSPGIATLQNGIWVGRDNLLNLPTSEIGLYFEILSPPSEKILVTKKELHDKVVPILTSAGLTSYPLFSGESPLPFFHVLIMLHPIEKGYVAYCTCRLFEAVQNARVVLQPDIFFQAITWERQEMIISPIDQLQEQVEKAVTAMTSTFADQAKTHKPAS